MRGVSDRLSGSSDLLTCTLPTSDQAGTRPDDSFGIRREVPSYVCSCRRYARYRKFERNNRSPFRVRRAMARISPMKTDERRSTGRAGPVKGDGKMKYVPERT